ncbi:M10 family metallopeptidase [Ensifer soli]|uniref:M10 family metallopeptidase n=1 Tax=Ciceribacter sp. sgz301302 TaxID=3342379 RepID=UPI0035BB57B3
MALPYFLAALRNGQQETQWYRPYANAADGERVTLTYSFMTSVPEGTATSYGDPNTSFETYSASEKALVEKALSIFTASIGVTFRLVTGAANIEFGQFDLARFSGYAYYLYYDKTEGTPYTDTPYGDVWLDVDREAGDRSLILHEVGHALGLKHPFEGKATLPEAQDKTSNTVMSYTWDTEMKTLGVFDVIALQSVYGPARARLGNDTYVFGRDTLIWDGGGRDTITAAAAKKAVTIDLNDGSWNFAGRKTASLLSDGQVYLGNFSMIENVTGGRFNDTLTGNELSNRIVGGAGDDRITGGAGADTLFGGPGADTFVYRAADDLGSLARFDRIRDFDAGDRIDLRKIDADETRGGNQAFTFLGSDSDGIAFTKGRGGQLWYDERRDILFIETDGDGIADHRLGIAGLSTLTADHFLL